MLLRLLSRYLAPYRSWLAVVLALQFVSTVAMLYLPSLNAGLAVKNAVAAKTAKMAASNTRPRLGRFSSSCSIASGPAFWLRSFRSIGRLFSR